MDKQLKLAIKELEEAKRCLGSKKIVPALDNLELARDRLKSIGLETHAELLQSEIDDLESKGLVVLAMYAREAANG